MSTTRGTVCFNHGKESGPGGRKIKALTAIAKNAGFAVQTLDYTDLPDADLRVKRLLASEPAQADRLILVGSSMGGYVATVASKVLKPDGLFLMAPAFYMPGYDSQNPVPHAKTVTVVHGWGDDVIPVEHSIRFAGKFSGGRRLELHLIEADHRLFPAERLVETLFGRFLDQVTGPAHI